MISSRGVVTSRCGNVISSHAVSKYDIHCIYTVI